MFVKKNLWHPNLPMGEYRMDVNDMVWGGELEPIVVLTRWDLLGVTLVGAMVWLCGVGGELHVEESQKACTCYLRGIESYHFLGFYRTFTL